MKPRKFSQEPKYQTELKQQKCILKIIMLEGEKNKGEEKESLLPNSPA